MALKIFSGEKRGLKLFLPKDPGFRPTQAMVKEAIFAMLDGVEQDASVLDLYAGSGSMGLEAISRGAETALFCEGSREAVSVIQKNAKLFPAKTKALTIMLAEFPRDYYQLDFYAPFDVIFMDPPYKMELEPGKILPYLTKNKLVNPNATLVWEMDPRTLKKLDAGGYPSWELFKPRAWGKKAAAFFRFIGEAEG
jgi:16S rRNA (guanine(966)-N(2))-methyltransferase RsmD